MSYQYYEYLKRFALVVADELRRGETIILRTPMGSCQCGDTIGWMWVDEESQTLMARTTGQMDWQTTNACPAREFINEKSPGYGMSATIGYLASVFEGLEPHPSDAKFALGRTNIANHHLWKLWRSFHKEMLENQRSTSTTS